jgi:putative chitinase
MRAIDIVRKLCPNANPAYVAAFERGDALLEQHGVTNPLRLAHFLCQVFHETGGLRILREDMRYSAKRIMEIFGVGRHSAAVTQAEAARLAGNGSALAERVYGLGNPRKARELGNTKPGDGWAYRGNGIMQTTGRGNHQRMGQRCGVDFTTRPELVTSAEHALKPALAEWTEGSLNTLADQNNIRAITKRINGGYNGLADRIAWFEKIWRMLDKGAVTVPAEPDKVSAPDPETVEVQRKLVLLGYKLKVDGHYGDATEAAIRDFQSKSGVMVDGVAGPVTIAAMDQRLNSTKAPTEPSAVEPPVIKKPVERGIDVGLGGISFMAILEWIFKLSDKVAAAPIIQYVIGALLVIALGLIAWGFIRPRLWKPKQGEVSS